MPMTVNLLVGTLKFKRDAYLRDSERRRLVPLIKVGQTYVIWWSRANEQRYKNKSEAAADA